MPRIFHDGLQHYFRLEGDALRPVLMLCHPIGADQSIWDRVVPLLLPHVRVLRHDLRGHGGTDVPAAPCTIDQLAGDVLAITQALGIERFSLAGLSLGALTTMKVALQAPEKVQALVVCSGSPRMNPPPGGWDGRIASALEHGMAPVADGMVSRMFTPGFVQAFPTLVASLRTVIERTDSRGFAHCAAVLRDADLWGELAGIRAPTLAACGKQDPLIPADTAEKVALAVRDGSATVFDSGHFPPVETPNEFSGAVLQLLQRAGVLGAATMSV